MPPRSLSDRSPISVMRWTDDQSSCSSSELQATSFKDSSKQARRSKGVRFVLEDNQVFPITHLDDMPEQEIAATWYDADEYSEIKASYQLTIFMMETGEALKGDHESRGLEYRTQEGAWARYENKRDAYNAVLDEQDRQWERDEDDFDELSRIYLAHSAKCAEAAAMRGSEDEKAAMDILKTIMPPRRRKSLYRKPSGDTMKAQEMLRELSSTRRSEIRDDIRQLERKQSRASPKKSVHRAVSV